MFGLSDEFVKEQLPEVGRNSRVHKEECAYCFRKSTTGDISSPDSGIFVCLKCQNAFCLEHLLTLHKQMREKNSRPMDCFYLHVVTYLVDTKEKTDEKSSQEEKRPRTLEELALQHADTRVRTTNYNIVFFDEKSGKRFDFPLIDGLQEMPKTALEEIYKKSSPDKELVEKFGEKQAFMIHTSAWNSVLAECFEVQKRVEVTSAALNAPEFAPVVSKFADNLEQLPVRPEQQTGPQKWHCEHPGCKFEDNLWFNLTDGTVLCGRANFAGLGNNHALEHYKETKYPLVVKIGTVTPTEAEVYSYTEDDMVLDPKLDEHLAHFGIDRKKLTKTDKTMAELTVDANEKYSFGRLTQDGKELEHLYGRGFTGLTNIGNSCYVNSILQSLFTLPEFVSVYGNSDICKEVMFRAGNDPSYDVLAQIAKVGDHLFGPNVRVPLDEKEEKHPDARLPPELYGVRTACGFRNSQWKTNEQRDAFEYLVFLLDEMEKREKSHLPEGVSPVIDHFKGTVEFRLEETDSKHVGYKTTPLRVLELNLPMELATGGSADDPEHPPHVKFEQCLDKFTSPAELEGYRSPETGTIVKATQRCALLDIPDVLFVRMHRFVAGPPDWQEKKLHVLVDTPEIIDFAPWIAPGGIQPGEIEIVGGAGAAGPSEDIDPVMLTSLLSMGFTEGQCRAALKKCHSVELATEWIFEHPDAVEEPPAPVSSSSSSSSSCKKKSFDPMLIESLTMMGFDEKRVVKALENTDGDGERAADWLLSHADEEIEEKVSEEKTKEKKSTRYELVAFISHIGRSATFGHYVCHAKRDGKWVLINDANVFKCDDVPIDLGYMYLFRRI